MSNLYKVSVGVPVYNVSGYIERCAESVFSQSYKDLDIVFVDDCSTDNSVALIKKTLQRFPMRKAQTRVIQLIHNQGVSAARNRLLDSFEGDFFTFVDADDYLKIDAIELLVQKQIQDDSDLVTGSIFVDHGTWTQVIEEPEYENVDSMLLHLCSSSTHHENVSRLFRLSVIRDNSISYNSDIRIGEDHLFLTNVVCFTNRISKLKDIVYYYDCTNQSSAMHQLINPQRMCKIYSSDIRTLDEMKKLVVHLQKDCDYVNGIEKLMARKIEDGFIEAIKCKDKETYSFIIPYIASIRNLNIDDRYLFKRLNKVGCLFYEIHFLYLWLRMAKHKIFRILRIIVND